MPLSATCRHLPGISSAFVKAWIANNFSGTRAIAVNGTEDRIDVFGRRLVVPIRAAGHNEVLADVDTIETEILVVE